MIRWAVLSALAAVATLLAISCSGTASPTSPAVTSISFIELPAEGNAYTAGETIWVDASFDQPVVVSGEPRVALTIGNATRQAEYFFGSGGSSLAFRYIVEAVDSDEDGVSIAVDSLSLNGGSISSTMNAETAADLRHAAVPADALHAVSGSMKMLLTGRMTLFGGAHEFSTVRARGVNSCAGTGGYDDFRPGMNVTIRDGTGAIIASTLTEPWSRLDLHPTYDDSAEAITDGAGIFGQCHVWWAVDVPLSDFYEVNVGRRGSLSYPRSEIEDSGWIIKSSLGQ